MKLIEADRERYSDDGKPPVAWEHYLEVAPGLAALDPEVRPEALAERELDPAAWTRAESYWVLTFALDLQVGRTDRIDAFGRACSEALSAKPAPDKRLDVATPAARSPDTAPQLAAPPVGEARAREVPAAVRTPAPDAPPAQLPPLAPVPTEPKALPSFLKAAETAPAPAASFAPVALAPPPAVAPAPPAIVAAPVSPPAPVAAAPVAPAPSFKGTIDFVPADIAPALPFGGAPSPDYAARLRTASPARPAAPARPDRPDATVDIGSVMSSLPFPGPRGAGSAGAGAARQAPSIPELTVEQHAMLSAELSMLRDGPSKAAALARYRVEGIAALTALGAHWKERLQKDPALTARWKAVYAEHQKGLSNKGG